MVLITVLTDMQVRMAIELSRESWTQHEGSDNLPFLHTSENIKIGCGKNYKFFLGWFDQSELRVRNV